MAGDGTTTATVLTRAILVEGCKSVAAGMNPMDLRRGINLAVEHVVAELKSRAKMISTTEEIAQVGGCGGSAVCSVCCMMLVFFGGGGILRKAQVRWLSLPPRKSRRWVRSAGRRVLLETEPSAVAGSAAWGLGALGADTPSPAAAWHHLRQTKEQ